MKSFQPKSKWVWAICLLAGLGFLLFYHYKSALWIKGVQLWDFLYDPHQLKAFISSFGRVPGTLMACLQGGKAFEHQYKSFLILLGISALVILAFYIYHEEIHHLIKRVKG
jgi:hypothetical protein